VASGVQKGKPKRGPREANREPRVFQESQREAQGSPREPRGSSREARGDSRKARDRPREPKTCQGPMRDPRQIREVLYSFSGSSCQTLVSLSRRETLPVRATCHKRAKDSQRVGGMSQGLRSSRLVLNRLVSQEVVRLGLDL
jgi:hypothetical protein